MTDLVMITGASSGLGLALARSVPFPATVVNISRSSPPDDSIRHYSADLSDPGTWEKTGEELKRLVEETDPDRAVFIHAAGILDPIGFAGEVDTDAYISNVLLNSAAGQVLGHLFLGAIAGRHGNFDLVMISSGAATSVYPGWSSYGSGKAALDQWVRNVGAEQEEQDEQSGVRVIAVAPGVIDTAMQEQIRNTSQEDFPKVDKFHVLYQDGVLSEPEVAAERVWNVIERGPTTGSVLDVRDL